MLLMRIVLTSLGVVCLAATTLAQRAVTGTGVGQRFPDLVLPALEDGRAVSLSEFRGHKLILHVFASW